MTSAISTISTGIDTAEKLAELKILIEQADQNLQNALANNTRRAYKNQWQQFVRWCDTMGLSPFPTEEKVLLIYLTHKVEKGAALTSVGQAYAAIREEHRMRNTTPPGLDGQFYRSWTGARKKASINREKKRAKALLPDDLKAAIQAAQGDLATRDAALLLIGWCGALRSEEVVNLSKSDISVEPDGLIIKIRQSKTDQAGVGYELGIARGETICPVEAWLSYDRGAPVDRDAAFVSKTGLPLSPRDVSRIVKRCLKRAGISPKGYSSHSLRAGCITAAAQAGHSLEAIQRQSRHKSLEVLLTYIRTATLLTNNITKGLL